MKKSAEPQKTTDGNLFFKELVSNLGTLFLQCRVKTADTRNKISELMSLGRNSIYRLENYGSARFKTVFKLLIYYGSSKLLTAADWTEICEKFSKILIPDAALKRLREPKNDALRKRLEKLLQYLLNRLKSKE